MTGKEYRQIRKSLKLSQTELAEKLGLHFVTIHKRETGDKPIAYEAQVAIKALADKISL
jgi:transcriptional regulator with XRE-family HTH domain